MSLVLSIDVGTTNLKAGVVNEDGQIKAFRRVRSPVHRPEQGASEHNPSELWDLIVSVSRDVASRWKHDIEKIVISTYQLGLVLIDENMQPLGGITLLSDLRARETHSEFCKTFDTESLYLRTGCPPMFQYPSSRLYYFKKKNPGLYNRTRYFLSSKDYLLYLFTGEILTEGSIAAATQLFDIRKFKWDESALEMLDISGNQLPGVVDGTHTALPVLDSVRRELGLTSTSVEILPGLYDGGALAVGLSGLARGVGVMNIGTSALMRAPGNVPIFDESPDMRLQPYCLTRDVFLNGGALNNAALTLNWLRDKVTPLDFNDMPALCEKKGPPVFCLPYLTGERDARIGAFASGVFFGLREHHSKRDMLRSIMEGVAFSLCMVKESLDPHNQIISELRIGGGGATSRIWTQIFSDVFNSPVSRPEGEETALVGNAMLAFVAWGVYKNLEEAGSKMIRINDRIDPDPEAVKIYSEYYQFFKTLRSQMAGMFEYHSRLKHIR
ncbi:MAG TPA: gluconokinase [Oligoflexia bacterium]|nr:gluconokinase [Oligoflexia bacterium]HMP47969.1 gluconokinase [Oligoflexia bacterium]